ncbi:Na+/H+ antiporter family protein [Corynebacterium freneyi]|uniref:Histidine transporter YuiF (NhaC family) n=1 Tax=Corynebacterium freneyi TaxID=134034 RepID=A0ABS4U7N5_9CORY|nr:Na+/H+ antiporter NhaC family protein [Corynebacterium freneyi]MBP2332670.1 putative histidine transporter YuiF (NhaC family) [Corynebacterium freneyi]QXA53175.1 TRAP transporter large permease subunit [Corynebacterium freneyi]WJZ05224.1 Na+/H+ antiporter family protein [Corynebacterium freneyi]
MNSVLIAVLVMLILAISRVHVVLALFIGALIGGLLGGLGFDGTLVAFQEGLSGGARIALSYALLGAFAMAVAQSGLPQLLANKIVGTVTGKDPEENAKAVGVVKWSMLGGFTLMAVLSQNLIPVHIAFIPLIVPPLLVAMNKLKIDRRAAACALTFGLVTTYMFIPLGFGSIFLNDILLGNIESAGLDTSDINILQAMGIPAAGMFTGLLVALFISYRKPRTYADEPIADTGARGSADADRDDLFPAGAADPDAAGDYAAVDTIARAATEPIERRKVIIAVVAIFATFGIQVWMQSTDFEADSLLIGALAGLAVFMITGGVNWREADDVFTAGMKMMALIGFIMISAQGFASVMTETGDVEPLVEATAEMFAGSQAAAAIAMLIVGLIVTMGIGSSFSTLPIISAIYVPLCAALGFSPLATVAIIGTAGALGDAGSPASDSTLGPTAGLNADGQHDHIRDSVIPTFIHFNLPLLAAGWIAAMVL